MVHIWPWKDVLVDFPTTIVLCKVPESWSTYGPETVKDNTCAHSVGDAVKVQLQTYNAYYVWVPGTIAERGARRPGDSVSYMVQLHVDATKMHNSLV